MGLRGSDSMKKVLVSTLIIGVLLLLGLLIFSLISKKSGNNGSSSSGSGKSISSSATDVKSRSTAASSSSAENKPSADRSKEYIYKNHPEFTPVNYDSPALLGLTKDTMLLYLSHHKGV